MFARCQKLKTQERNVDLSLYFFCSFCALRNTMLANFLHNIDRWQTWNVLAWQKYRICNVTCGRWKKNVNNKREMTQDDNRLGKMFMHLCRIIFHESGQKLIPGSHQISFITFYCEYRCESASLCVRENLWPPRKSLWCTYIINTFPEPTTVNFRQVISYSYVYHFSWHNVTKRRD